MKTLLVLLLLIPPISCFGLSDNYKRSIEKNLNIAKQKSSTYVWGAAGNERNGVLEVDCSGLIFHVFKLSGVPVKRSTSFRMRHGLDGWLGKDVSIDDCDHLDLCFFTWKGQEAARPFGHVGFLAEDNKSKLLEITHASGSAKKIVSQQLRGTMLRDLKAIRTITIGDKKK